MFGERDERCTGGNHAFKRPKERFGLLSRRGHLILRPAELNDDMERTAAAFFALHPNSAVHHLHQLPREGEAEAAPAVFPSSEPVNLRKDVENHPLFVG